MLLYVRLKPNSSGLRFLGEIQLDCSNHFRYWLQNGDECGDPVTALPQTLHHGPVQSVRLLQNDSETTTEHGLCRASDAGSNWEQGLTSESCRRLHAPEAYLSSVVGNDCMDGLALHVTGLLVNDEHGATFAYPGDRVGLTWMSCKVSTVLVSLEDGAAGDVLKSWLVDARAKRFVMVWEDRPLRQHRFKIQARDRSTISSTSRWFQTPPARCQSFSASDEDALAGAGCAHLTVDGISRFRQRALELHNFPRLLCLVRKVPHARTIRIYQQS